MVLHEKDSCVILVDAQEKLIPFVHMHEDLIARCEWILKVAALLEIPTLVSEQYPQGLGNTIPALKAAAGNALVVTKTEFSCADNAQCVEAIDNLNREQVVLIGIETHVCVLQTAFGLQEMGKDVFVVADATESRRMQDKVLAID